MNEKQIENEIQNLIALRTYYNTVVIALTGGLVGLMYNITPLNKVLFCIGLIMGIIFYLKSKYTTKKINFLIKRGL